MKNKIQKSSEDKSAKPSTTKSRHSWPTCKNCLYYYAPL